MDQRLTRSRGDTDEVITVATALDAIARLERRPIGTVVLTGPNASSPEVVAFLVEHYPSVRIERVD